MLRTGAVFSAVLTWNLTALSSFWFLAISIIVGGDSLRKQKTAQRYCTNAKTHTSVWQDATALNNL